MTDPVMVHMLTENAMGQANKRDRTNEWFVPAFGPPGFRALVGLLFLPYTGMVLAYTMIGSMLAPNIHADRVLAVLAIYFLALGVGAHALDAVGSKESKPWGDAFSVLHLCVLATLSLSAAYAIGIYYMLFYTPLLWIIAIPEGFFVLAYNLEWFKGRFHTDAWFAVSWGSLPVLSGYILQTNEISLAALAIAAAMGFMSLVQIKASRPYKALKRAHADGVIDTDTVQIEVLEQILKSISVGVIVLAVGLAIWREWT
ncbi:MAG: hypothetical protein L0H63_02130 [Nitrococcus sp.]|nr:hypothetical protein [Nitrococcus sp.]